MFVNYDECILNYVASIRRYLGLSSEYKADERFSAYLEQIKPRQIVLFLIDGMGSRLIERKLPEDSFLRSHLYKETSTVFPPTTTAATTAILNGRSANQNAWLGWKQYFKEVDDIVVPFLNTGEYSNKHYGDDFAMQALPVDNMIDELNANGIKSSFIYPDFHPQGFKTFKEQCDKMLQLSSEEDHRFTYVYWTKYDSLMHKYGIDHKECDDELKNIDMILQEAAKEIPDDVLMIVIADHGMIDMHKEINVYHTALNEHLSRPIALENRATAFYVKDGHGEAFEKLFKETYSDDFILLSQKQVIDTHLFGDLDNHPRFEEMIGDYLAIAKKDAYFAYSENDDHFKFVGHHAGCTDDELMIPVITYYK